MKLQKFNGGVSTRKASHLIGINEGTACTNVDIENELLGPVKQPTAAGLALTNNARYIKYNDAIDTLAKLPHTKVEYRDKTYYSVLGDFIQVKDDNTEGDLGLDQPVIADATVGNSKPVKPLAGDIVVTQEDLAPGTVNADGFVPGTVYQFAITSVVGGVESLPYLFSVTAEALLNGSPSGYVKLFKFQNTTAASRLYQKIAGVWKAYQVGIYTAGITTFAATAVFSIYFRSSAITLGYTFGWSLPADVDAMLLETTFVGNYDYVATVYSSSLGWESKPSPIISVKPSDATDSVTFNINFAQDTRIDIVRLYRLGNTITDFTLVSEHVVDVNSSTTLAAADNYPDTAISGNAILKSIKYSKVLTGVTNLSVTNGQLIGTIGTKLVYSEPGAVFAFPSTNYRDFKETLTGVYAIDAGLLVFSATHTWLINTSNLATGKVIQLSDEFGCVGHDTITGYKTGAMWSSLQGFCVSAGGRVELVSKNRIGYKDLDITKAVMYNETYYGFTAKGVCYAFDMRYETAFVDFIFKVFDDSDATTEIRQVYIDGTELKVLFGSTSAVDSYTLFSSVQDETFIWHSAKFIEGSHTELKHYKDVYMYSSGTLTITILIDDVEVLTKDLYEDGFHNIKIPQDKQEGYGIQYTIVGTGQVTELEYKTMGRQNGR